MTHFLSDRAYLTAVQVGNLVRSLALGGTHHGVEHEFDVRLLPEDARDDLEPPAHFDEPALIYVCPPILLLIWLHPCFELSAQQYQVTGHHVALRKPGSGHNV